MWLLFDDDTISRSMNSQLPGNCEGGINSQLSYYK
jgi:hypothetical protein